MTVTVVTVTVVTVFLSEGEMFRTEFVPASLSFLRACCYIHFSLPTHALINLKHLHSSHLKTTHVKKMSVMRT